jgi:4-amino-4-deoxy-L-arabinose transferase
VLKLPNLGHPSLKPLDESFHAIVAQNLMHHPWLPTLNDGPAIDIDYRDWQNARVFLHKPPMAMWQIALSYAIFGVNTFALRFPSLVLSTLAVWLTYLIGKELVDPTAGLVAAALQAFNAPIAMLVHGHVFSDHVDISLLFWTQLAIWLLLVARRPPPQPSPGVPGEGVRWWILCGIAQGFAFLSKSYPALIVTVLCVAGYLLERNRFSGRAVRTVILATVLTILPWNLYAFMRWPDQFVHENLHALRHLTEDIEQWAAPWDRLVFDYWLRIFHVYYPAVIVAAIVVIVRAWKTQDARLWLLVVWGFGVLIPHLLATSKTMTATLVGWPAMWLMLGYLVSQAIKGDRLAAGAWAVAMVLPFLLGKDAIPASGWGYSPRPGFAMIMREHLWVVWFVLASLAAGGLVMLIKPEVVTHVLVGVAGTAMLVLGVRTYGYLSWRVTQVKTEASSFVEFAPLANQLPAEAVLIVDEQSKLENKLMQFQVRHTCYPWKGLDWRDMGRQIIDAGGLPYLVTDRPQDLPVVFSADGRTVYACSPRAAAAAKHQSP